jgi:AraC-like DNA-binding protein
LQSGGKKLYEEDFYINQQPPSGNDRCFLHCFAYGETIWQGKYQLRRSHDAFKNYKYGDEHWSFEVITDGDAIMTCNKMRYKAVAEDALLLRPGKQISLRTGPSGFMCKKTVMIKSPLLKYMCENGGLAGVNHIPSNDSTRLRVICDNIKEIILSQNEYWQQEISNECYAFLCELNRMAKPQQYPTALHRALNVIDSNPYRDYDLESLSMECQVSVSTLFRLFKKYLDISPVNYIIDRRLEQARRLLSISDMNLKEIAEKCGYQSQSFLSRAFKKKFGLPPSQFRQKR